MNPTNQTNPIKQFESNIQRWVSIDNQLKLLHEKTKELREQKNQIGKNIQEYTSQNNLSNVTIQISDGKLKCVNTHVAAPLTYKYLEKSLGEIIKNENQVNQIINYLKEKREIKVVPEIRRIYNNI